MKRHALTGLKVLASFPLALIIGGLGARILENGLWPLLFFPDNWLSVIDTVTTIGGQAVAFCALIWFWVLDH
jgi:hypothetical protein